MVSYKDFNSLKIYDKEAIHELLFRMGVIGLDDTSKVQKYYDALPMRIRKDGVYRGFTDTIVQTNMYEWLDRMLEYFDVFFSYSKYD